MSPNVQVCLFSALALESLHLTAKFMRDAVRIHVKRHELRLLRDIHHHPDYPRARQFSGECGALGSECKPWRL